MYRTARTAAIAAVLATGALAGCGDNPEATESPATEALGAETTETQPEATSGPAGSPAATEPTPTLEPTQDDALSLQIEIADGNVTPPPDRVSVGLGERVRIEVTSDQADGVHLHGYDIAAEVSSSEPAVLELTAERAGRFELEAHDQGLQLLQLVVE